MFGIRLKGRDVWAGSKNITYFINEDGYFSRPIANQQDPAVFGVPFRRRKIWPDIDAVKRSLRGIKGKEVLVHTGLISAWVNDPAQQGTYSRYELVDFTTGKTSALPI
jgi:hypothetical protein